MQRISTFSNNIVRRIHVWSEKHLTPKQFLLVLSFFVGIGAALAAWLLKWLIHEIEHLLTSHFIATGSNWLYLVYPIVGILLTALFIYAQWIAEEDSNYASWMDYEQDNLSYYTSARQEDMRF